jgi:hypothetical protein
LILSTFLGRGGTSVLTAEDIIKAAHLPDWRSANCSAEGPPPEEARTVALEIFSVSNREAYTSPLLIPPQQRRVPFRRRFARVGRAARRARMSAVPLCRLGSRWTHRMIKLRSCLRGG